ncbi:hypothetical protein KCU65_g443, partial [Aureobasidium melanogenum]
MNWEADGEVEADKVERRTEDKVRNLRHDETCGEGLPVRLKLGDDTWSNEDVVENCEEIELRCCGRSRHSYAVVLGTRRLAGSVLDHGIERARADIDHMLSGVTARWASSVIPAEVFLDSLRVFSNVTEVDSLASTSEKKQCVELCKQLGGRLVDDHLDQFNSDCDTLSLFDRKAGTRLADKGMFEIVKLQKVNDVKGS